MVKKKVKKKAKKQVVCRPENDGFKERTKTGIPGLDELVGGGIPRGNLVVLSGDPGSGKTIFCLMFLEEGIEHYGEPGIYVSLEEPTEQIISLADEFGFDFNKHVQDGMLKIVTVELYDFDKLKNTIEDAITSVNAKRVVIDPGVVFHLFFEKDLDARKSILSLGKLLKQMNCTSIVTNEINLDQTRSLFGLEEYVADGVILLYHTKSENKFIRSVAVLKMRGTRISERLSPVQITKDGIRVLSKQEMFEDVD